MNDNNECLRGEAFMCLLKWLCDDSTHEPEAVVAACDTLALSESDIEYLCQKYPFNKPNIVPISHFIKF